MSSERYFIKVFRTDPSAIGAGGRITSGSPLYPLYGNMFGLLIGDTDTDTSYLGQERSSVSPGHGTSRSISVDGAAPAEGADLWHGASAEGYVKDGPIYTMRKREGTGTGLIDSMNGNGPYDVRVSTLGNDLAGLAGYFGFKDRPGMPAEAQAVRKHVENDKAVLGRFLRSQLSNWYSSKDSPMRNTPIVTVVSAPESAVVSLDDRLSRGYDSWLDDTNEFHLKRFRPVEQVVIGQDPRSMPSAEWDKFVQSVYPYADDVTSDEDMKDIARCIADDYRALLKQRNITSAIRSM